MNCERRAEKERQALGFFKPVEEEARSGSATVVADGGHDRRIRVSQSECCVLMTFDPYHILT